MDNVVTYTFQDNHNDIIYATILNDSNRYKFAMTQNARKDVAGIVTFDLTGLLPTNQNYGLYITVAYWSL